MFEDCRESMAYEDDGWAHDEEKQTWPNFVSMFGKLWRGE